MHPYHVIRINRMLTCAGADRLQTGMRGAYGKPEGLVARVRINQILLSLRTKTNFLNFAIEAFKRATFKFPGRQNILVSQKWGFTNYDAAEFEKLRAANMFNYQGCSASKKRAHGPITVDAIMPEFLKQ